MTFGVNQSPDSLIARAAEANKGGVSSTSPVVPKSKINHLGGKAVSQKFSEEVELSRNWHWIWSKFYFNRKHKGYFFALIGGLPTFFSAVLKYVLYLIIFNPKKSKIYLHRAMGYLNAAIGRKSFFRPNIKI